ncbi:hypothetical protein Tco_0700603 [Tanacetum coccineum]
MAPRLTKSSIYSRSLGLVACASLERMLSDFAGEVWEQNRVLAGFGIGGKREKGFIQIMPPRMMTRISGRSTAAPRGGRTGRRPGRGGGRTVEPTGRGGGRTREQDGQGGGRGNGVNGGVNEVPDFFTVIDQQL